jgi:hypothetical protein
MVTVFGRTLKDKRPLPAGRRRSGALIAFLIRKCNQYPISRTFKN